jgi:hypothetical protein
MRPGENPLLEAKSMRRRGTLIASALKWQPAGVPMPQPRDSLTCGTRRHPTQNATPGDLGRHPEQNPFDFSRFEGWFAGIENKALKLGDFSIAGLEDVCVVERKDLPDLVHSLTAHRDLFVRRLRLMSRYRHRLLVIAAALSEVKSPYAYAGNPNRIAQSLIAMLAGLQVPFLRAETHELAEECVASYLYQVHLYYWLETNDYGRFLADNNL